MSENVGVYVRIGRYEGDLAFFIPGQPQGKGRARSTRSGHHYTPEKTRAYERLIAQTAALAMYQSGQWITDQPCSVEITATLAIPPSWSKSKRQAAQDGELMPTSRPDLDNITKAVLDGCNGIVWRDDSQVCRIAAAKNYSIPSQSL